MSSKVNFEKLLEPGYIGKVKTRNRMIKSGAGTGGLAAPADKRARPEILNYYEAIAKGGVGMLIYESSNIEPNAMLGSAFNIYNDDNIQAHKDIVDVIHKHGCPTFMQLYHFGPLLFGPFCVSSSKVNYPSRLDMNNMVPRELTTDEVKAKQEMFISAAVRIQKAGFDGVEINAGCSHLLAAFLSRFWNKTRVDQYGPQSLENRARIVTEIITGIKKRCGTDYPVSVLFNGIEANVFELGNSLDCLTFEESAGFAKLFEQAGAAYLHVRTAAIGNHIGGFFPDRFFIPVSGHTGYGTVMDWKKDFFPGFVSKYDGAAGFVEIAAKIKKSVSIPVGTVGVMDPRLAPELIENALRDGKIDFVLMNRPLIADPDLPNKLAAGKRRDVRPCTRCLSCFQGAMFCRVNAAVSRAGGATMPEGYDIQTASTKKKVMVVGGGPAGMEAARVAALRGHQVTLYEKSSRLGGLLPVAEIVKGPHEQLADFTNYLSNQIISLGIKVKLGQEVNPSLVDKVKPDVVIIAAGGLHTTFDLPGIKNSKVINSASLQALAQTGLRFVTPTALSSLTKIYLPVGKKVVIIGGQIQGVEIAEFLVRRGRIVTIVDEGPLTNLGLNMAQNVANMVIPYLQGKGVKILMGVKYKEVTDKGLIITTSYSITKTLAADNIILALPLAPNTALTDSLKGKVNEVYAVGDCKNPKVIIDAIADANLTARKI
ncbi:MAG: FAD-dependent oxidoreductase [Dehalococcoidales bacterium]